MKIKTLLLGTAAAFAVAGSAQAADLAVAESVEYVKVCDAYGAGYFYVPGSDVCLKIGGYVQFRTYFFDEQRQLGIDPGNSIIGDPTSPFSGQPYDASWKLFTETSLNATAKWMTDWGAATVFLDYRSDVDIGNDQFSLGRFHGVFLDTGYLKVGGLKAGWDASTYDWGFNGFIGYPTNFDHDQHMDQIQWSTTLGGFGFFLGVEDPRDNPQSFLYTGDMPDLVVALTNSVGAFTWKWSAAATDTVYGTGWGTQLGVGWAGPAGSFLKVQAAVGNDAGALFAANYNPNGNGGTPWHVAAQGGIAWTSAFATLIGGGYREQNGAADIEASIEADWTLARGVQAGIAVQYVDPDAGDAVTEIQARIQAGF
jgi:hypothetical protein